MITLDTSALAEAVDGLSDLSSIVGDLEDVAAEAWIQFTDEIAGSGRAPGTNWPIGTVDARGNYVEPGEGRESGRSLQAWVPEFDGLQVVAKNDARDPRTGRRYAQFVHLRGERPGAAMRRAEEAFARAFDEAGQRMADIIEGRLADGRA